MKRILSLALTLIQVVPLSIAIATPDRFERILSNDLDQIAHHGSSIVSLGRQRLLSCWFAGTRESARDVQIFCTRSEDNGDTWGKPEIVVANGEKAEGSWYANKTVGNCSLYLDSKDRIWLFYAAVVWGGWSGSHVDYKTSDDGGLTWSPSKRLVGGLGNLPRNKAIPYSRDRILLPLYHELLSHSGYGYLLKLQDGAIEKEKSVTLAIPGEGHLQPTFIAWPDRRIFAYLRKKGQGSVQFSAFDRKTMAWSEPESLNLPNPDAALDAIAHPKYGALLVYNHSSTARTPLSLAFAKDGKSFTKAFDFESDPKGSFSYPALIRDSQGTYHLTYTHGGRGGIKYVRWNEAWLQTQLDSIE